MEEVFKSLNIAAKILARRTNEIWDILLGTEQEAKQLARSVLSDTSIRLQTKYMGTRGTKLTVHGVPADICEEPMGAFFLNFGRVDEVNVPINKFGITTGDMVLQVTLTRKAFWEISNILMCRERRMLSWWRDTTVGHVEPRGTCSRCTPLRIHNLHLVQRQQKQQQ